MQDRHPLAIFSQHCHECFNATMLPQLRSKVSQELAHVNTSTVRSNAKRALAKHNALMAYKRMQVTPAPHITDPKTAELEKAVASAEGSALPELVEILVETGTQPTQREISRIKNTASFLESQRVYLELLERYNPGMRMDQGENVQRSAQRVGLLVPHSKFSRN